MTFAFEGKGGLDSFFNAQFPVGSWADMDDDDELDCLNYSAPAPLKTGLKRNSSHANLQLFNEGVFQVCPPTPFPYSACVHRDCSPQRVAKPALTRRAACGDIEE
jgi:hypothetical protein